MRLISSAAVAVGAAALQPFIIAADYGSVQQTAAGFSGSPLVTTTAKAPAGSVVVMTLTDGTNQNSVGAILDQNVGDQTHNLNSWTTNDMSPSGWPIRTATSVLSVDLPIGSHLGMVMATLFATRSRLMIVAMCIPTGTGIDAFGTTTGGFSATPSFATSAFTSGNPEYSVVFGVAYQPTGATPGTGWTLVGTSGTAVGYTPSQNANSRLYMFVSTKVLTAPTFNATWIPNSGANFSLNSLGVKV